MTQAEYKRQWNKDNAEHVKKQHREYRTNNPEVNRRAQRRFQFKNKYGITEERYEEMIKSQDNKCKLCGGPPNGRGALHVDHIHGTKVVRGLLCSKCNTGLGLFNDDPSLLKKAVEYVKAYANG